MKGQNTSSKKSLGQAAKQVGLFAVAALSAASILAMQSANLPSRRSTSNPNPDASQDASNPGTDLPAGESAEPAKATTGESETDTTKRLLTDPFLQLPTDSSVQIVWFTEFKGTEHWVEYGEAQTTRATTTKMSRTREDSDSRVPGRAFTEVTPRNIWRHQVTVEGLTPGDRIPYRVISRHATGRTIPSDFFTLGANPPTGQPLKILLTSDHQLKPLTPANLQKVEETVGRVDAVFLAGDLVNIPDRASEWFDDAEGFAFFPGLQGRANHTLEKENSTTTYTGGQLIQHAPLFPALGNHEVMGRFSDNKGLNAQFDDTIPRQQASRLYPAPGGGEASKKWIEDHSFNSKTYEEIFSLPAAKLPDGEETEAYYAISVGDVRLVSLYVTQIWRSPNLTPDTKGRYRERQADLKDPKSWGYGQHIFEPIRRGSPQYEWLKQELTSDAFKNAKYKVVMLHHPPHTLGGNIVPAFTDPVPVETRAEDGTLQAMQYEYPKEKDYIVSDLLPLLEVANVDLVFYGHSHLWNRFVSPKGTHFLESSNVGNSYGAHLADNPRKVPNEADVKAAGDLKAFEKAYSAIGDPNGLEPVMPTLAPLEDDSGSPIPYIASNDITSFTIFDTGTGTLSSYYYDSRKPGSPVVKFDEFELSQ